MKVGNPTVIMVKRVLKNELVLSGVYIVAIVFIAMWQFKIFYHEVIPASRYLPDDVDISQRANKYDSTIYLDDDYLPIALYYSDRYIRQMVYEPQERNTLVNLFNSENEPFVVITRNWALNNLDENDIEYVLLDQNDSFSIVKKP